MKSQIFAGIALLIAGVVTVEINKVKEPELQIKEVVVPSTQEMIQKSSLNDIRDEIEVTEDSTSTLIRETIQDRVIDSTVMPTKDSVIK